MLKYNLLLAWRSLVKRKLTAAIMLTGLTIGLTCVTLIGVFVFHETSYDTTFSHFDKIYRFTFRNDQGKHMAGSPAALSPYLESYFPSVDAVCRVFYPYMRAGTTGLVESQGKRIYERKIIYGDSTFFRFFDAPFLEGDIETALDAPDKIVLSRAAAARYFENGQALGNLITLNGEHVFRVSGVVDFPTNSHFNFDFIMTPYFQPRLLEEWTRWPCWTYLKINNDQQIFTIEEDINDILLTHAFPYDLLWSSYKFILQPLEQIHTSSEMSWDVVPKVAKRQLNMLLSIALAVLALGCINFINLATAKATERAKETGIKKLFGAKKESLVPQFMLEALFLCLAAGILALIISSMLLPHFNTLADAKISISYFDIKVIGSVLTTSVVTALLAGVYPAVVISSFSPGQILKNKHTATGSHSWLRKTLVTFQFFISAALVAATWVMKDQLVFMQQMDLGFDQQGVLSVRLRQANKETFERVKNELMTHSDIEKVSAASHTLGAGSGTWSFYPPGMDLADQQAIADYMRVDYGFFDLMDIEFVQGRPFSEMYASDLGQGLIINESAAELWKLEDPLSTPLRTDIDAGFMEERSIVGVVKNFHYKSPEFDVTPLVLDIDSSSAYRHVYVKSNHMNASLAVIENLWSEYFPEYPVEYSFQDEVFSRTYSNHQIYRRIMGISGSIALLISAIGLLGLVSFILAKKKKEMGIRKILGASLAQLFMLISRQFLWLVIVANVLAIPIAYYGVREWLMGFASRTNVDAMIFVYTLLGSILLVFMVISYNTVRSALRNPVDVIRAE